MSNFEKFIERSNKIHNNKYSYEKFQYVNAKTASTIICPEHGEFLQKPDHHTRLHARGCPVCVNIHKTLVCKANRANKGHLMGPKIMTIETFTNLAYEKFGNKFTFDFTNYNGTTKNKIRICCPEHGWFEKVPRLMFLKNNKCGCNKCGLSSVAKAKTKSYNNFIEQVNIVHNNFYTYPESNNDKYINKKSIMDIVCPIHGNFEKKAQKHLSGQGCFRCRMNKLIAEGKLPGGYNEELFKNNDFVKNRRATLYFIKLNDGKYYKIGITINLKRRINGLKSKSRNWIKEIETLFTYEDTLENVFYLEQDILEKFSYCRTVLYFSTELFTEDISKHKNFKKIFNNS